MAPKKKGGRKQAADDWEVELGETVDPIAQATEDATKAETEQDATVDGDADGIGGGLLAALRKNKNKRAKKGKATIDDLDGEEDADGVTSPQVDLDNKAPEEATFDDEDDVFAGGPVKKGKGGKKQPGIAADDEAAAEDEANGTGLVKSKKEKEKEKKEREKQRKKEQVSPKWLLQHRDGRILTLATGRKEEVDSSNFQRQSRANEACCGGHTRGRS